jgi:hypothetical protein
MNPKPLVVSSADDSSPVDSRALVVFTGMCYLFVGLGFSFLDRRFGSFGLESCLWLAWAVLGFGAGTVNVGRSTGAGQTQWVILGLIGALLALFPGFALYNLLRWVSLLLMVIIGARAAVLKTRRDVYFTLTGIFVVSFMVGTHGNADWTLWFYLGPAWAFGGLALAWDHAAGASLSRLTKMLMTTGFIAVALLLSIALFFFAPRPPILGFGFLPPGTDTQGMFQQPPGGNDQKGRGSKNGGSGTGVGTGQGSAGAPQQDGLGQQWDAMLRGMRKSVSDITIPQWQRGIMGNALDWAQVLQGLLASKTFKPSGEFVEVEMQRQAEQKRVSWRVNWLLMLIPLLVGYLLWHRRYQFGLSLLLGCSQLLVRWSPSHSMRLSALAVKWCLHMRGHKRHPGQSVREHLVTATGVAPLAKRWLGYAVESYCVMRFGGVPATTQHAINMRKAVLGACDIMMGVAPELAK